MSNDNDDDVFTINEVEGYLKVILDANNIEFDFSTPLVWCDEVKFDDLERIESDLGITPRKIKNHQEQTKIVFNSLDGDDGGN